MKILSLGFASAALIGAVMFAGAATAAPMMPVGAQAGQISSENMIVQVQGGPRRARAFSGNRAAPRAFGGGGGRRVVRGGRGFGTGAAIGLGILGAAVVGGAIANSCWRRQEVLDPYGYVVGYRRVYVC